MVIAGWRLSPGLLITLAACYVAYFWSDPIGDNVWSPLGRNMLSNDSPGYINFSPDRTAGYPVFLNLITIVFGSVQAAPKVQLVLLATAVSFLGWSVYRIFSAPYFAPILTLVLFGLSAVSKFHAYILSEALFISLLCTMMGCLIMLVAYPTVRLAAATALICGVAITVRPVGLSLLAIWPPLIWFIWGRFAGKRWRLVAVMIAPLVLCAAAERVTWRHMHGEIGPRPHRVDYHLFGTVLMMESEPSMQDDQLAALMAEARRAWAPGRDLVRNAPDWQTQTLLTRFFEVAGHYIAGRGSPSLRRQIKKLTEQRGEIRVNRLLRDVGWSALLAAPEEWAANVWLHYRGLWAHHSIYGTNLVHRYVSYTQGRDVTAPIRMPPGLKVLPQRGPLPQTDVSLNRLATVAAFLASVLVVGLAVWQRLGKVAQESPLVEKREGPASRVKSPDDDLVAAAMAAIVVHGYFLATAMFAAANLRYSATMWTFEALYSLLLVRWALKFWNHCRSAKVSLT